jgi:hypothetical protein
MAKLLLYLLLTQIIIASSLYLPINNPINSDIEKMALLSNMPTAKKPYSLHMLQHYNEKIKSTNNELYFKIHKVITPLSSFYAQEKLSANIAYTTRTSQSVPNTNGIDYNSSYQLQTTSFLNLNHYFKSTIDISFYEKEKGLKIATHNSYLSLGFNAFQIDIGHKDHYYGPFKTGSMLISNNALNSPSFSISNATPLTPLAFTYEIFLSQLEEVSNISSDQGSSSGRPGLLGMMFSFNLTSFSEIGFYRTFQFGGGNRDVNLQDIWDAIKDPVTKDNTGSDGYNQDQANYEFGNQQAMITINTKWNQKTEHPFSLYFLYGGEDTAQHGNSRLGNIVYGQGFYYPFLSNNISFRYEFIEFQPAWYVHHLYQNGYTNSNNIMGLWLAERRLNRDGVGGKMNEISLDIQTKAYHYFLQGSYYKFENYSDKKYNNGYRIKLDIETNQQKVPLNLSFVHEQTSSNHSLSYINAGFRL